jgi:hypothetical protein
MGGTCWWLVEYGWNMLMASGIWWAAIIGLIGELLGSTLEK